MADWLFDDDLLLTELGAALREDDVPQWVVAAAKDAYAWRTIDAELAELSADSADNLEAVGARGAESTAVRALSFEAPSLTIEVDIGPEGLLGQFVPPQPGMVQIRTRTRLLATIPVDDLGRFSILSGPLAPFRLYCETSAGVRVLTDWVSV
jgi:hypothetical protein